MHSRSKQPMLDPAGPSTDGASEPGWFDAIYRRHRADLVRYAERRGAEDAEGVADLALLDLARAADRLRSRDEPVIRAYLYKAARNRAARSRNNPTEDVDDFGDIEDPALSSFDDVIAATLDLDEMLAELSPPQEAALRLRFFRHMTSAEAADVMQVDASTVRTHQRRGLTRLRQLILAAAVVLAAVGLVAAFRGGDDRIRIDGPVAPGDDSTTVPTTTTIPAEIPVGSAVPTIGRANPGQLTTTATDPSPPDEAPTSSPSTASPSTATSGLTTTLSTTSSQPTTSSPPTTVLSTTTTVPTTSSSAPSTQTSSTTLPANQATFLSIFDGNRIHFSSLLPERDCLTQSGFGLLLDPDTCRTDVHTLWWVTTTDDRASYTIADLQQTSCWTADGADVIVSGCADAISQKWIIDHTAAYRIRSAQNGRCLEVRGSYADPTIGLAACLPQDNVTPDNRHQLWGIYGYPR